MKLVRGALRRRVFRGFREGSGFWLAVGAFGVAARLVRMLASREHPSVVERLDPGQTLVITCEPPA